MENIRGSFGNNVEEEKFNKYFITSLRMIILDKLFDRDMVEISQQLGLRKFLESQTGNPDPIDIHDGLLIAHNDESAVSEIEEKRIFLENISDIQELLRLANKAGVTEEEIAQAKSDALSAMQ